MLSDTRCPGTGPRERASYRAVLCLVISVRSVFTICHLSHHWDCQRFNACVKYKAHLPLSSLVVSEDLPWKPSDQSTLIQGPKWGAWPTDFKPSLSLLTASLQCAWEHTVKVGTGDYSLEVNRGSLLLFDFPFSLATGLSLWGPSAKQQLMLSGGGGQKQTSLSILWLCSRVAVDPPHLCSLNLMIRNSFWGVNFFLFLTLFFWPWSRWCQDLFWKEHYVSWWCVVASWPLACFVALNKSPDFFEPQFHYRMSRLDENESSFNPNWISWNKG